MKLVVGHWIVDSLQNEITNTVSAQVVKLEPKAIAVLMYLVDKPNQVISREELIENVWDGRTVSDHAIYRVINIIRKKMDPDDRDAYITTLSKKGYKLVQAVSYISTEETETDQLNIDADSKTKHPLSTNDNVIPKQALSEPIKYTIFFSFIALGIYLLWALVLAGKWRYYSLPIYSNIKPLTDSEHQENYPKFSRDGQFIVFSKKNFQSDTYHIFLKNLISGEIQQLTDSNYNDLNPALSNDAQTIIYSRQGDDYCDVFKLYLIDKEYEEKKLFSCLGNEAIDLEITDDNNSLFYTLLEKNNPTRRIYSYDLRTTRRKRLTEAYVDTAMGDREINLSWDNNKLLFLRNDNWEKTQICAYDILLGEVDCLTDVDSYIQSVSWADNSNENVMYQSSFNKLYIYNNKHKFTKNIVSSLGGFNMSTHALNMKKIAVMQEENEYGMWKIINPDFSGSIQGSATVEKILFSDVLDFNPTFANTSKKFAFVSKRSGTQQIWVYDNNGGIKQLTNFTDKRTIQHLSWSPDDKYLVSYSFKFENLYLIDTETGIKTTLLDDDSYTNAAVPTWSHNGQYVYFSSNKIDDYDVYRIDILSKKIERITTNGVGMLFEPSKSERYYIKAYEDGLWQFNKDGSSTLIIDEINFTNYKSVNFTSNTIVSTNLKGTEVSSYNKKNKNITKISLPVTPKNEANVTMSFDGSQIVFEDTFNDKSKIYLLNP